MIFSSLSLFLLINLLSLQISAQTTSVFIHANAEQYFTSDGFFATLVSFQASVMPVQLGHANEKFDISHYLIISNAAVTYSVDNGSFVTFPLCYQGTSSNRGGFYEVWSFVARLFSPKKPPMAVAYAGSLQDANTNRVYWDNNNGSNYQLTLPPVIKLVPGISSFSPVNPFVLDKIDGVNGTSTYYLTGQIFAQVTPVAPGHSVNLFYRLKPDQPFSSIPMSWSNNDASGTDPSFLTHENWEYAAPFIFNQDPQLKDSKFEFYVQCIDRISKQVYVDTNGGKFFSAKVLVDL